MPSTNGIAASKTMIQISDSTNHKVSCGFSVHLVRRHMNPAAAAAAIRIQMIM
jgi:hypothetical protein